MPKLRNAKSPVGKMAQYLARKCVIHSPQAELDLVGKAAENAPRFGKRRLHKGSKVYMLRASDTDQFVAISPKGRAMKVTVEEVDLEELDADSFVEVGA